MKCIGCFIKQVVFKIIIMIKADGLGLPVTMCVCAPACGVLKMSRVQKAWLIGVIVYTLSPQGKRMGCKRGWLVISDHWTSSEERAGRGVVGERPCA